MEYLSIFRTEFSDDTCSMKYQVSNPQYEKVQKRKGDYHVDNFGYKNEKHEPDRIFRTVRWKRANPSDQKIGCSLGSWV